MGIPADTTPEEAPIPNGCFYPDITPRWLRISFAGVIPSPDKPPLPAVNPNRTILCEYISPGMYVGYLDDMVCLLTFHETLTRIDCTTGLYTTFGFTGPGCTFWGPNALDPLIESYYDGNFQIAFFGSPNARQSINGAADLIPVPIEPGLMADFWPGENNKFSIRFASQKNKNRAIILIDNG